MILGLGGNEIRRDCQKARAMNYSNRQELDTQAIVSEAKYWTSSGWQVLCKLRGYSGVENKRAPGRSVATAGRSHRTDQEFTVQ